MCKSSDDQDEFQMLRDGEKCIWELPQGTRRQEVQLAIVLWVLLVPCMLIAAPDLLFGRVNPNVAIPFEFWLQVVFVIPFCVIALMAISRLIFHPEPCRLVWDSQSFSFDSGRYGWGYLSNRYDDESEGNEIFRRMFQRHIRWNLSRAEAIKHPLRWSVSEKEWLLHVSDEEYSFGVNIPEKHRTCLVGLFHSWQASPKGLQQTFDIAIDTMKNR